MDEVQPINITGPGVAECASGQTLISVWVAALLATVLLTIASFPGYMSYDSIQALLQARTAVEGSQYPPFGSYVWRLFDWIAPGPTLMQFAQNGLMLFSFAFVIMRTGFPSAVKILCIFCYVMLPPILGTMLVVWKDVAVGACYMAALALLISITSEMAGARRRLIVAVALFFIWCAMAYRFNAATGAFPLIMYAIWKSSPGSGGRKFVMTALTSAVITLAFCVAVWVLNNYRLPTFERLQRNTNSDSIMQYDLIGMSVFADKPLVLGADGSMVSPNYLKSIYDPRHLNITGMNDREHRIAPNPGPIASRWLSAIRAHPLAYLKHRTAVFREYIGLHRHDVFYVTHPNIDGNTLGISSTPTKFKGYFSQYLWNVRASIFCRAWIYYAIPILLIIILVQVRATRFRTEAITALCSGYLYLLPMYIVSPAADLRYNFWSISACVLASILAVAGIIYREQAQAFEGSNNQFGIKF